jgi:hypothetical protein
MEELQELALCPSNHHQVLKVVYLLILRLFALV